MMRKLVFFVILFVCFVSASWAESVEFFKGSAQEALKKAGSEGKLCFMEFVADYCYTCKQMDASVFKSDDVAWYVKNNYVPIKINVQDFDGISTAQQYNIGAYVPVFIVFNSKGKELDRYVGSMSTSVFLTFLKKYDVPENKVRIGSPPAPTPAPPVTVTKPTASGGGGSTALATVADNLPAEVLYRFSAKRVPSSGYGVQIGSFYSYDAVLNEVDRFERSFAVNVLVNVSTLNNKPVYKVIAGSYLDKDDAISLQTSMKAKGYGNTFIKDLSTIKQN